MKPEPISPIEPDTGLTATAARWVARRDGGLTADERRALRTWLAAAPAHGAAFARADAARTEFDWPLHAGAVDDVLAGLAARAKKRRRRRHLIAAGGSVAALILMVALLRPARAPDAPRVPPAPPTLTVLEPQRQTLPDGTIVELNAAARITTEFSATARVVVLSQGTAHFQVAKHTRPFIVKAAGVTAQALGTVFTVELDARKVSVLVTEGRVAVNQERAAVPAPASPTSSAVEPMALLGAGNTVNIPLTPEAATAAPAVAVLSTAEIEDRLSWRRPRLEFNGTPLSEVVAMINRHNQAQFVIADAALEKLALSGILRADKTEALMQMLELDFQVRVERRGDQIILRKGP